MSEPLRGRGAQANPSGRFELLQVSYDPGEGLGRVRTQFLRDDSQSVISRHASPDLPFEASLNPYRGCEHGCAYCYARPTHEYLGFSAGVDFESRILVKHRAAELLRAELMMPRYVAKRLSMSGVTDPYQPVERELKITRGCLEVLAEFRHAVVMITKNHLITRDADLLMELARFEAAAVYISITTLDSGLARELEPRASSPRQRLEAIRELAAKGVPVGVSVAPLIPGLNDSEIPAIVKAARDAGAQFAGYTVVRLPHGVKEVFGEWLERHRPGMKDKILGRIAECQGATMSSGEFGTRLKGQGIWAEQISRWFNVSLRREGLAHRRPEVNEGAFRRADGMRDLFDEVSG